MVVVCVMRHLWCGNCIPNLWSDDTVLQLKFQNTFHTHTASTRVAQETCSSTGDVGYIYWESIT